MDAQAGPQQQGLLRFPASAARTSGAAAGGSSGGSGSSGAAAAQADVKRRHSMAEEVALITQRIVKRLKSGPRSHAQATAATATAKLSLAVAASAAGRRNLSSSSLASSDTTVASSSSDSDCSAATAGAVGGVGVGAAAVLGDGSDGGSGLTAVDGGDGRCSSPSSASDGDSSAAAAAATAGACAWTNSSSSGGGGAFGPSAAAAAAASAFHLFDDGEREYLAACLDKERAVQAADAAEAAAAAAAAATAAAAPPPTGARALFQQLRLGHQHQHQHNHQHHHHQHHHHHHHHHPQQQQPHALVGAAVDPHKRLVLVDWLVEVVDEFRLSQESLHLAVALLDRFLARAPRVPRCQLQLLGVACLWTAAKYEEVSPPALADFVDVTDRSCRGRDVVRMEAVVLGTLRYELAGPTRLSFLQALLAHGQRAAAAKQQQFQQQQQQQQQVGHLANYLLELSLLTPDATAARQPPSLVAAAALQLASNLLAAGADPASRASHGALCRTLGAAAGGGAGALERCMADLRRMAAWASTAAAQPAVRLKYSEARLGGVARLLLQQQPPPQASPPPPQAPPPPPQQQPHLSHGSSVAVGVAGRGGSPERPVAVFA